jgi:peptide/nickel transport system permease protein
VASEQIGWFDRVQKLLDRWFVTPFRIVWQDWRGKVGLVLFVSYLFMGTVGPVITNKPTYGQGPRRTAPFQDPSYILGTGDLGRSILSQIVHSTPTMLIMITSGAVFATSVAIAVGISSGYKGGKLDRALMTLTDIVMTIPGLPLIIILSTLIPVGSPWAIGILLSINSWAGLARSLRSQVLSLRHESYVESSRCLGLSQRTILAYDIIPNVMPYIAIHFMNSARSIIFGAVGLYFIGVLPYTEENWGTLLNNSYQSGAIWTSDLYMFLIPLFTIVLFTLSLILLAQSLDAIFNPRLRARHSATSGDDEGTPAMPE